MNTQGVTKFLKTIQKGIVKHSPELLTAIGIGGMVTTTVLAVKATPKALKKIEDEKDKQDVDKLKPVDVVKVTWKDYAPAVVTGVASTACLIGAQSINLRRNAALVTAYQISTTALNEYKEATAEVVGEETVKEIRDKVVEEKKERGNKNVDSTASLSSYSLDEDVLIRESISGQYFWSTEEKIKEIKNDLNGRMIDGREYSISLNELLIELGLKRHILGDNIGWNVDRRIDLYCDDSHTDNKKPCFEIAYLTPPEYGYRDYYR